MKKLVILGAGFAGVWAALGARRLASKLGERLEITIIAKTNFLGIRPRFYEDNLEHHAVDLSKIFLDLNILTVNDRVTAIDTKSKLVTTEKSSFTYDGLINALGSEIQIPSMSQDAPIFSIDNFNQAQEFKRFLNSVSLKGCLRIAIAGAGFTGIEFAMELPKRLRAMGCKQFEISLVERNSHVGPEFGPKARKKIEEALKSEGIKVYTGVSISKNSTGAVILSDGTKILSQALVWTGGVKPSSLSREISQKLDNSSRILVDEFLQVPDCENVWAAGDVAAPLVDGKNRSAMSCQHAIPQGKIAGYNAAAKLLGFAQIKYRQELYVVCLDLGDWGALVTSGWRRDRVLASGPDAKPVKVMINRYTIYPTLNNPQQLLKSAAPDNIGFAKATAAEFALWLKPVRNLITSSFLKQEKP